MHKIVQKFCTQSVIFDTFSQFMRFPVSARRHTRFFLKGSAEMTLVKIAEGCPDLGQRIIRFQNHFHRSCISCLYSSPVAISSNTAAKILV